MEKHEKTALLGLAIGLISGGMLGAFVVDGVPLLLAWNWKIGTYWIWTTTVFIVGGVLGFLCSDYFLPPEKHHIPVGVVKEK